MACRPGGAVKSTLTLIGDVHGLLDPWEASHFRHPAPARSGDRERRAARPACRGSGPVRRVGRGCRRAPRGGRGAAAGVGGGAGRTGCAEVLEHRYQGNAADHQQAAEDPPDRCRVTLEAYPAEMIEQDRGDDTRCDEHS